MALSTVLLFVAGGPPADLRAGSASVRNVRSGKWSDPSTWSTHAVPSASAAVAIVSGTTVEYDVSSSPEIPFVEIAGVLTFSRTRSSRLDVGNIFVRDGGVLDMGTPDRIIPAAVVAEIRFVVPKDAVYAGRDFAPSDVGLWVFHGGRWDIHGSPVRQTWAKLARPLNAGETTVVVRDDVRDWPQGASIVVTPTSVDPQAAEFEERVVASVRRQADGLHAVTLSAPLLYTHDGRPQSAGEVALLTRNVRVMSKYPDRPKAHTMFMAGSSGQIAYAEFKDLGTLGVLSRYPIHFHTMGESSRGMTVRGASIWRSDNHFINIHGSNGVTIVDTVGYDAAGSGFFIEGLRTPESLTDGRRQQTKGERQRGQGDAVPQASPGEKQRAKQKRREEQRAQGLRKGTEPSGNMDFVFTRNLAAKGFWRPGSLDDPQRAALFWIAAFNGRVVGNVAVGARGRRDSSGFHFAEHADASPNRPPLLMLANEAHSNAGHGLFAWTNTKLPLEIIGFRSWRNGRTGITLGAYNHQVRLFRLIMTENRDANVAVWVLRTWIQDSILERSRVGVYFHRHKLAGQPGDPSMIINSQFRDHAAADVSQDHTPCDSPGEDLSAVSRRCPPNYARFIGSQFHSSRAIDFGWHENAHSWIDTIGWRNRPAGLPVAFRLQRQDQSEGASVQRIFDAVLRPLSSVWDFPPTVDLAVTEATPGIARLRAEAADDRAIAAVEFLADGEMVQRLTQPPYEILWSVQVQSGRLTYVYARAFDKAGNVAYSQVIPFVVRSR